MAKYKGIEVRDNVRQLLPHMPLIEEYREMLQSLQAVWDNLNLLGQMSGTTAEIGQTREAFASLTGELLNNLAEQTLAKREQEMKARSQVVIDILIRNLFERTADIGFLSTDDAIRQFAANPGEPWALQQRFREYVRKYSVYEDVVLLDRNGRILARLKPDERITGIHDDWVRAAATTSAPYVEAYGPSELFPGQAQSLIYAYKITSGLGDTLAVLALCFRFGDEMTRIFQGLAQADDAGVMALLDAGGQVIASSDRWQVPLGAELQVASGSLQRLRFAGRSYLAFASDTKGYQGYMGPGWRGLVLMPVDHAFEIHDDHQLDAIEPALLASVMAGGRAFSEALRAIPQQAEGIQRDLSRAVWNGTVRQGSSAAAVNSAFSKILLREISRIGMSMREVFSRSIGNLQATVLSSLLADSQFFAALAIDIMDRNLYERANDCRWWALDGNIRAQLANPDNKNRQAEMEKIIAYINSLYTVYDNILLFDDEGCVQAVANPNYASLVGKTLDAPWVADCLALPDSQSYTVSEFGRSPLYASRPTYIYLAALRAPDDSRVTGGIAIVFDSEPQFSAMLNDSLPREASGEPVAGSFAVFVDDAARIIASTDSNYRIGETLTLPDELLKPAASGCSRLIALDGQVMAVGARPSTGYREYKGKEDSYRNALSALVFIPLGAYDAQARLGNDSGEVVARRASPAADVAIREIATFHLGGHWLGLPVSAVVEAIELNGAACLANAPKQVYGALIYRNEALPIYNLHAALGLDESDEAGVGQQVVVVRGENGKLFGILVDQLGEVMETPLSDIEDLANIYVGIASVLASVVKTAPGTNAPMLVLLSVASMSEQLRGRSEAATQPA
ncbi:chemotaxis protein CheW [Quatrionicoccus australiensis]|uniref:chemotaxis protein CheW n=1 Tax=Quatrionicoccus australiensis TaxID=138118 RepID=UPI001CFB9983|nr:chemotaxis protein CheW [Quatrionicoccus australiensis]MCB4361652.1 chemotaxis protein CheW [Quatrionicoccus australiensis]